jgi:hypothetical protein
VLRLQRTSQLGLVRAVYPTANHDRWQHSIGVYGSVVRYVSALLADSEIPTFRILASETDVEHAFVAALFHDLGQSPYGHDIEAACSNLYRHEELVRRIANDESLGKPTLADTLAAYWPNVSLDRVLSILKGPNRTPGAVPSRPLDAVISDIINGPIDADKYDYLPRDSAGCGVVYGYGIDRERLLRSLTVTAAVAETSSRLALAYKAKGSSAINSMLLGRALMYEAVYWHHAVRCLETMLIHAVASTFEGLTKNAKRYRGCLATQRTVQELFYQMVICERSFADATHSMTTNRLVDLAVESPPPSVQRDSTLAFIWQLADDPNRRLILRIASRDLFRRLFEAKVAALEDHTSYSALREQLSPERRVEMAVSLQRLLLDAAHNEAQQRGGAQHTTTESEERTAIQRMLASPEVLLVIDFPNKGVPEERNWPREVGDPARKYVSLPEQPTKPAAAFQRVRALQEAAASLRVYVAPRLHDTVTRYLGPARIHECVAQLIPSVRGIGE